jgi:hypothetical protein
VAVGALEVLKNDLSGLGRLRSPGTSGWLQSYDDHLATLTTDSEQDRATMRIKF